MEAFCAAVLLAYLLDLWLGDPPYRLHPVRMIGAVIGGVRWALMRMGLSGKAGGVFLVLATQGVVLAAYFTARWALTRLWPPLGFILDVALLYSLLALKDLIVHVGVVAGAVEGADFSEARLALSRVVGRDTACLSGEALCRGAVETMAENFVDGFFSPLFWYILGGALGFCFFGFPPIPAGVGAMLFFKAASTLDSMVGYKSPELLSFGWAGARLDDGMNFIPARLSLPLLTLGAWASRLHPLRGFRVALRDRLKHDSPNAGHAEAFFSGALGVRLGGPTSYGGEEKDKAWLGAEFGDPDPGHIRAAERLVYRSGWMAVIVSMGLILVGFR